MNRFSRSGNTKKRNYKTLADKIRSKIQFVRVLFAVLSVVLYTLFTVIMLVYSWGNTVYIYTIVLFILIYVIIFTIYIFILRMRGKGVYKSFKDYKSGLKILRSLLTLISIFLTLSIFSVSLLSDIKSMGFQLAVLIISLAWAIFQIIYQISKMIKRHNRNKRKNI